MNKNSGFIFLEILITIAIIGIAFISLLDIGVLALNISYSIKQATQADSLVREELESLRSFKDGTTWATDGLGTMNTGSGNPYYLVLDNGVSPSKWALHTGTETIDVFTRKVFVDKVSRDPTTKNIEASYNAAHDDPDTRKVTAIVSWGSKTNQVITYLTNWKP